MIGSLAPQGMNGGGHNGHAAVPLVFNGAGRHDPGNTAARADEHGDERLAGQPEFAENAVHDEGDTRHVATALQKSEEQEEHQHLGHEAQYGADAPDDTV